MVFGHVVGGIDVVRQVEALPVDANSRPLQDVRIVKCGELVKQVKGEISKSIFVINFLLFCDLLLQFMICLFQFERKKRKRKRRKNQRKTVRKRRKNIKKIRKKKRKRKKGECSL